MTDNLLNKSIGPCLISYTFALCLVFGLTELALGHLHYLSTYVPLRMCPNVRTERFVE